MYEQIREDALFIMLYAVVTAMAIIACCYMLLRQGNAFAADITPPLRLRRWAAAFFASFALNHVWYMPILFHIASDDVTMVDHVGGLLDSLTFFPLAIAVMLVMLQDRRRPLWPAFVMMVPMAGGAAWSVANNSYGPLPVFYGYALLIGIGIIIYMVRALRQYERWLRDNYADLEHKEVWQSFVVLLIIILVFVAYAFTIEGPAYQYAMQVLCIVLICHLLWRVETLSDLSTPAPETRTPEARTPDNIGLLLQQHCIDTQLYLQHDLTLAQLAKAIGTNRTYLGQFFSTQGVTYNAYINGLRVGHFVGLYQEAAADHHSFTAQQLALESGFRSYRTFSEAFKRETGQTVTVWMKMQQAAGAH